MGDTGMRAQTARVRADIAGSRRGEESRSERVEAFWVHDAAVRGLWVGRDLEEMKAAGGDWLVSVCLCSSSAGHLTLPADTHHVSSTVRRRRLDSEVLQA